jgi:two-component system, NtrC family, response regulator AtoC
MILKAHLGSGVYKSGSVSEGIESIGEDLFFVAASPTMRKLHAQAELLARVNVPVLILGESGSGKEITARLIHELSAPSCCRFLRVHCAALPGDLLESELFGYERGSFAGTPHIRQNPAESCDRGTLLLDEISEMPGSLQARLAHALQDKQLFRLGGASTLQVRILAATSINIEQALADKTLRMDLHHRLSVFTVHVPPLRKRKDEIPLLLDHFMNRMAECCGLLPRAIPAELVEECQRYSWPGNVRELGDFVKRYLVMEDGSLAPNDLKLRLDLLPEEAACRRLSKQSINNVIESNSEESSLKTLVRSIKGETERNAIMTALEQTHWNRKEAAQLLRISYRGLLYKIQQYQLSPAAPAIPRTSRVESDDEKSVPLPFPVLGNA